LFYSKFLDLTGGVYLLILKNLHQPKDIYHHSQKPSDIKLFVSLNDTWNSRVQGHGIRVVLYALVGLVTVGSIEISYRVYIYGSYYVPLISQCFIIRGQCNKRNRCSDYTKIDGVSVLRYQVLPDAISHAVVTH